MTVGVVLLPLLDPGLDAVNVGLHLVRVVAPELDDDLLAVRVPRLLQQHLHDLAVEVLLQLGLGVVSVDGKVSPPANELVVSAFSSAYLVFSRS